MAADLNHYYFSQITPRESLFPSVPAMRFYVTCPSPSFYILKIELFLGIDPWNGCGNWIGAEAAASYLCHSDHLYTDMGKTEE